MPANTTLDNAPMSPISSIHESTKFAREVKRGADHFHKWKRGNVNADEPEAKPFPFPPRNATGRHNDRIYNEGKQHFAAAQKKLVHRHPIVAVDPTTDFPNILDGEPVRARASPGREPDADVAYSFDHAKGPSNGSDVLTVALGKAVERFEDQKTRKLVRDEYDVVVGDEEEHLATGRPVEEDFEMLEPF